MSRPLTLHESADLLGRYRYVELAAFSVLGRRATSCAVPDAATYLSGASLAHAWRARLVEERLPVSAGLPGVAECTRSPSTQLDGALELLVDAGDAEVIDGLLGALYPAMAAAYLERLSIVSSASDPPIARLLGRLLADLDALRRDGAESAALLPVPAPGTRRGLGELLGAGGGPFGPLRSAAPTEAGLPLRAGAPTQSGA